MEPFCKHSYKFENLKIWFILKTAQIIDKAANKIFLNMQKCFSTEQGLIWGANKI